jgi:hypothetical protein
LFGDITSLAFLAFLSPYRWRENETAAIVDDGFEISDGI